MSDDTQGTSSPNYTPSSAGMPDAFYPPWEGEWGYSTGGVKNTQIQPQTGGVEDLIQTLHKGGELPEKDGAYLTCSDCGGEERAASNVGEVNLVALDLDGVSEDLIEHLLSEVLGGCCSIRYGTFSDGLMSKGYLQLLGLLKHPKVIHGGAEVHDRVLTVAREAGLAPQEAANLLGLVMRYRGEDEESKRRLQDAFEGLGVHTNDVIKQNRNQRKLKEDRLPTLGSMLAALKWAGPTGRRVRVLVPLSKKLDQDHHRALYRWMTEPLRELPSGVNVDACGIQPAQAMYTMRDNPGRPSELLIINGPILDPDALPDGRGIKEVLGEQRKSDASSYSARRKKRSQGGARVFTWGGDLPVEGFDVEGWIKRHGFSVRGPVRWRGGGFLWTFDECPWRAGDDPGAAYIIQHYSGAVSAGCHHHNCPGSKSKGNHWKALRHKTEEKAITKAIAVLENVSKGGSEERSKALKRFTEAAQGWEGLKPESCEELRQRAVDAAKKAGVAEPTRTIKRIVDRARPPKTDSELRGTSIFKTCPGAPVPLEYIVPARYRVTPDATVLLTYQDEGGGYEMLLPTPVLLTGRVKDIDTGEEHVRLAWHRDGGWVSHVVPRGVVADQRSIVALAARGLPVTSSTAKRVVEYVAELEAFNIDLLVPQRSTQQMGWVGGDQTTFLVGSTRITFSEGIVPLDKDQKGGVAFLGADVGDVQIASAWHASGDPQAWWGVFREVMGHPKVFAGVMASLVAPLLAILRCPSFVMDFSGTTSKGKSTAQLVAASVWGQPISGSEPCVGHSWDATKVGLERTAGLTCDLPLILDDTKSARHPDVVGAVVYGYTSGTGRLRGSKKGLAGITGWRGVLISSGEKSITAFALGQAGIRGRILALSGAPFEGDPDAMRRLTKSVRWSLTNTYGHLGPLFVRYVLRHSEQWEEWRQDHRDKVEMLASGVGGNELAGRLAEPFAVLLVAAELLAKIAPVEIPQWDVIMPLWDEIVAGVKDRDTFSDALRHVYDWATGNQAKFWPRGNREPHQGWAGRWDDGTNQPIYFLRDRLRDVLAGGGFDLDDIWGEWVARGWVHKGEGRHRGRKLDLDGVRVRLLEIKSEAIAEVEFDGESEEDKAPGRKLRLVPQFVVEDDDEDIDDILDAFHK